MTCEICGVTLEKPEERRTVRTRMELDAPAREVVCCPVCAERVGIKDAFGWILIGVDFGFDGKSMVSLLDITCP